MASQFYEVAYRREGDARPGFSCTVLLRTVAAGSHEEAIMEMAAVAPEVTILSTRSLP